MMKHPRDHCAVGNLLTAANIQFGPPIEPLKRIRLYDGKEWQEFVAEWVSSCMKPKYKSFQSSDGANDLGIDVAGFVDDKQLLGVWDNYQCKHYDHPIVPSDVWVEFGKILWHSFQGAYVPPRAYFFVAPQGAGTSLSNLLSNASALKAGLFRAWGKYCRTEITTTQVVNLTGEFVEYVERFDFGIFRSIPPLSLIEQHRASPYFVARFGGGLPPRPKPAAPPDEIATVEHGYVSQLLAAYAEHKKEQVPGISSLKKWGTLNQHFNRQREAFYHAESLREFVRDKVEAGTFESLQEEIYNGVIDVHDSDYPDGYRCVVEVTGAAINLPISSHPLSASTFNSDKHGICHQLANEGRFKWCK